MTGRWTSTASASLDDEGVDAALTALPGIGPWTSTIYRLMVLGRPDAWPIHDIALAQAIAELRGLESGRRPTMLRLAEAWRPCRRSPPGSCGTTTAVRAERRASKGR